MLAETPKAGEVWHVKMINATCLTTKKVLEKTLHTVLLDDVESLSSYTKRRYEISDIKFVEKAKVNIGEKP